MKRIGLLVLTAFLVCPVAAQEPDLGTEAQREAGGILYQAKCAHCHGENGNGIGPATDFHRPAPRDFTSSTFKFRTTLSGELPTDDDIRRSIRNGMPYTGMPAWASLSEAEITNLVYFIKTFSDFFSGPFGVVTPIEIPKAPKFSEESLVRGREVYLENQCSDCHGDQGRGDGGSALTLKDQWGYHIRPADLTKRWTFRGGSTREDIYRTFTTGLDGSPMPSYEIQPEEDQWALVNYVYSLSRDEPEYASTVVAMPVDGEITDEALASAESSYFRVAGQVIEPGRAFFPGANAVQVRALVNESQVALQLKWNDLFADIKGTNAPDLPVEEPWTGAPDTSGTFSDAVAVQFPSALPEGTERPYFLFGDRKLSTDIWFADLSGPTGRHYVGRGSGSLEETGPPLDVSANYDQGEWTVVFKRDRDVEGAIGFTEGVFVPIAFSVWDGFNAESGNRRGLTSWFTMYVDVADKPSPTLPVLGYGLATLLLGLGLTFGMRRRGSRV